MVKHLYHFRAGQKAALHTNVTRAWDGTWRKWYVVPSEAQPARITLTLTPDMAQFLNVFGSFGEVITEEQALEERAALERAIEAERERVDKHNAAIYAEVERMGFNAMELPMYGPFEAAWERFPIIKALRKAEKATGIKCMFAERR